MDENCSQDLHIEDTFHVLTSVWSHPVHVMNFRMLRFSKGRSRSFHPTSTKWEFGNIRGEYGLLLLSILQILRHF